MVAICRIRWLTLLNLLACARRVWLAYVRFLATYVLAIIELRWWALPIESLPFQFLTRFLFLFSGLSSGAILC